MGIITDIYYHCLVRLIGVHSPPVEDQFIDMICRRKTFMECIKAVHKGTALLQFKI